MNSFLLTYLLGVIFNLVILIVTLIKDNYLRINIKDAVFFLLASWLIYPIVLLRAR